VDNAPAGSVAVGVIAPVRIVTSYHGTNAVRAEEILRTQRIKPSENVWDWIGHGVYFWENAPLRAWQWAEKKYGDEAAVVVADVKLGVCLDLTDTRYTSILKFAHQRLVQLHAARGEVLPENRGKARYLDCLVVNYVAEQILRDVETVRATFLEGDPIYSGSAFFTQSHIQVCVRAHQNIVSPIRLHIKGQ
jgi:hypothetical protein